MLAIADITTLKAAKENAGTLGFPSKMPGTAYGIPAHACIIGAKLAQLKGTTCHDCYALKNNYTYPSVIKSQATRLASLRNPQWVNAMVYHILKAHGLIDGRVHRKLKSPGWHRWHDAGDVQSLNHIANICEVARRTPTIRHWLPTREMGIVDAYRKSGGIVPGNLCIRVSATKVDGAPTQAWPTTSTVHQNAPARGQACPAPLQGNACQDCRACWDHTVENVSYHKH